MFGKNTLLISFIPQSISGKLVYIFYLLKPRQLKLQECSLISGKLMSAWATLLSQGSLDTFLQCFQRAIVLSLPPNPPSPPACWPTDRGPQGFLSPLSLLPPPACQTVSPSSKPECGAEWFRVLCGAGHS